MQGNLHFMKEKVSKVLRSFLLLISKRDKKALGFFIICGCLLNLLDILGLAVIGLLLSVSVRGIKSESVGDLTQTILDSIGILNFSLETQATILGLIAVLLFVTKSYLSVRINQKTLRLLSDVAAVISVSIFKKILASNQAFFQKHARHEVLHSTLIGVRYLSLDVLGGLATLLIDATFLILVLGALLFIDWAVALLTFSIFGLAGLVIYRSLSNRVFNLSSKTTESSIHLGQLFTDSLDLQKEIQLAGSESVFVNKFASSRKELSQTTAELALIPNIGKYVIETLAVTSGIFIAGIQFALKDAVHAIALLTVFLAAGSRVGPAVLRVQNTLTQIKTGLGYAEKTLDLMDELKGLDVETSILVDPSRDFESKVEISNVTFAYDKGASILNNISLTIVPGSFVAVVGDTGAGKSTLINLLLGFVEPNSGAITISGLKPRHTMTLFPGKIALVPQEVKLISGSIFENIALGQVYNKINAERCIEALGKVKLLTFVNAMPKDIQSDIGELGNLLSGGQRQRIGIARALYSRPQLIVLDEATSSLDGLTEDAIISELLNLREIDLTLIVIAHRLSTIKSADRVIYLGGATIRGDSDFETLRKSIPEFDAQAKIMGIN